jgi:hypothetical protein
MEILTTINQPLQSNLHIHTNNKIYKYYLQVNKKIKYQQLINTKYQNKVIIYYHQNLKMHNLKIINKKIKLCTVQVWYFRVVIKD